MIHIAATCCRTFGGLPSLLYPRGYGLHVQNALSHQVADHTTDLHSRQRSLQSDLCNHTTVRDRYRHRLLVECTHTNAACTQAIRSLGVIATFAIDTDIACNRTSVMTLLFCGVALRCNQSTNSQLCGNLYEFLLGCNRDLFPKILFISSIIIE